MNKEITSKIIGQLKPEAGLYDWWKSDQVEIPFFDNKKLTIAFAGCDPERDPTFIEEADRALTNFFKLTSKDRQAISGLVEQHCQDFLKEIGEEELVRITNPNEIWDFVYPTEIFLKRRPNRDQDIYLVIACECEWEEEHGLQLVFRQGKQLTRLSAQDGHLTEANAYGKPDEEDELLSQFK
ncbi:MAG: hypothetical protein MUC97_08400 [Bernardetiaceae bacterium]|nr:hypothetical protein [Bernardetiaceae bacterium]